jgi:hypothetical protein
MGKPRKVKRTAPGGSSANTISVGLSVTIILDEPLEADDAFELKGAGGKYAKTLTVKDATQLATGARILRFTGVKAKQQYRIVHKRSKASERPIVLDTPLASMTSSAKAPRLNDPGFIEYNSQVSKRLHDKYGIDRDVDPDLVQRSPIVNSLKVEDPKL